MSGLRILFASCHCYLDPGSGAAQAERDILELLAARGHACRALATGVLDYERHTPLEQVLDEIGAPYQHAEVAIRRRGPARVLDLELGGVRATLMPTASSRLERAPSWREGAIFRELADQVFGRFQPEILLTYGGHPVCLDLMRRARSRGIAVVFHLHNFGYDNARCFADASAVLVPSQFSARHFAEHLGIQCTAIPYPLNRERVVADDPEPTYVTFVNPQPAKGLTVFAQIALELSKRRPEIPLLVVEGRGAADWLAQVPLDLSGIENLHRMSNTPTPRDIYRVTRVLLVPSLWRESFGRVAAEGLANGLPVIASDRGALPETMGDAGFLFTVPARYTPQVREVPTSREIEPFVSTIERLYDGAWQNTQRARATIEAERWADEVVAQQYEQFFSRLIGQGLSAG